MITIPTVAQLRAQIIADIEGKIGQTIPTMPKAFFRVLATAQAGVLALVYRFGAWIYDQIFPATAASEALVRIGEQYGLYRTPAVATILTLTATGTNGVVIEGGTLWTDGTTVYQQEADVEIAAGTATVTVEALTAGDATNQATSATLSLVTPLAGVNSDATVASTTTTGEDSEALETYRTRILNRLANRPQGGSVADYVGWAGEVAGIVKAFAFRTAAGEVTVYPLIALSGTRIPAAPKLTEVQNYLQDTVRRPLCANVYAAAMTERVVNLTVTNVTPSNATMRATITAALTDYLLKRFPQQYADESAPTNTIIAGALVSEALAAGAKLIEFSMYMDGDVSPSTYYLLDDDEIVRLGTITWP